MKKVLVNRNKWRKSEKSHIRPFTPSKINISESELCNYYSCNHPNFFTYLLVKEDSSGDITFQHANCSLGHFIRDF